MADDPVAKSGWKLSDRITGALGCLMSIALGVYLYSGGQLRNRSGQLIGGTPKDRIWGVAIGAIGAACLVIVWWVWWLGSGPRPSHPRTMVGPYPTRRRAMNTWTTRLVLAAAVPVLILVMISDLPGYQKTFSIAAFVAASLISGWIGAPLASASGLGSGGFDGRSADPGARSLL